LSYKQEAAGSIPASPINVAVAQPVERPPETRGAAGSIPAGHTSGSVAQTAELPVLTRDGAGSTPAGATRGRTATGAVSRLENGWASGPWGFDSLSFRLRSGVVELARRATVNRERQVRALPPEPHAPVVETAMTPGLNPEAAGSTPAGGARRIASGCGGAWSPRRLRAPEIAGSTPAGQTCAVEERLSSRAS
jgi:hypothetical protein